VGQPSRTVASRRRRRRPAGEGGDQHFLPFFITKTLPIFSFYLFKYNILYESFKMGFVVK
jgi:hypothetical protein